MGPAGLISTEGFHVLFIAVTPLNWHLLTCNDLSISSLPPLPKKQTEKSLPISLICVTHNDTVHKAHQALNDALTARRRRKLYRRFATHKRVIGTAHAGRPQRPRASPPVVPHAQLVPLEQFFINKI